MGTTISRDGRRRVDDDAVMAGVREQVAGAPGRSRVCVPRVTWVAARCASRRLPAAPGVTMTLTRRPHTGVLSGLTSMRSAPAALCVPSPAAAACARVPCRVRGLWVRHVCAALAETVRSG
jgi:hypothetical protein